MTSSTRSRTSLLVALAVATALGQWVTTGTDTLTAPEGRRWLGIQAIAADDSGRLHAVWSEAITTGRRRLLYARHLPDSGWTVADTITEGAGSGSALAVERTTGCAHVGFTAGTGDSSETWYATNRAGDWDPVRLSADTVYDVSPTVALEKDSLPHLAWITVDTSEAYRIAYATNRAGDWQVQTLWGSRLGGFGTGAAPFLAVEPTGIAHVSYRGGDYQDYHIHHAQSRAPGDTGWTYEILSTVNLQDYSSALHAAESGELFLVASGNDGWGMPFRTCYLHRPPGSVIWDPYVLITADASAALRGFAFEGGAVHITWEEISGNVALGNIWHCSNASGSFFNSPLRVDRATNNAALAIDLEHRGHCLATWVPDIDTTRIDCIHSAPLTGLTGWRGPAIRPLRMEPTVLRPGGVLHLAGARPGMAELFAPDGRLVARLHHDGPDLRWYGADRHGRPAAAGTYIVRADGSCGTVRLVR